MTSPFSHVAIVLVRPQHSGNIGAIARSIANHGLGDLYIVDPPAFDPDIARWMAPNAHEIINRAKIVPDIPSAIESFNIVFGASARNRKWLIQEENIPRLSQRALSKERIAILFGPEDSGLSNFDLQYCHAMISLPTHEHASLNLSQAVNVFGAHLMQALEGDLDQKIFEEVAIALNQKLLLSWFRGCINVLGDEQSYWGRLSTSALRDDLDRLQYDLVKSVIALCAEHEGGKDKVMHWAETNNSYIARWKGLIEDIKTDELNFGSVNIAFRSLSDLSKSR